MRVNDDQLGVVSQNFSDYFLPWAELTEKHAL